MDPEVQHAWTSITTWLARHAPITAAAVQPPASGDVIMQTIQNVGHELPDDVLTWWQLMDGMDDYRAGFLVPAVFQPLSVTNVAQEYARRVRYTDPMCCRSGGMHRQAGEVGAGYCTEAIPLCRDLGGDLLALDLRPGPGHGRLVNFKTEQGFFTTGWAGVAAMLADIATRLEDAGGHSVVPEIVEGGVLVWSPNEELD